MAPCRGESRSPISRVRKELSNYPTMAFSYEETGDGYLVALEYVEQKTSLKPVIKNGGVSGGVNAVLMYIQEHPGVKTKELALALSLSRRTLERELKELRESGEIIYQGSAKTGGYFIKS